MNTARSTRVAVNGYGVIGKRVADAVARQDKLTFRCSPIRRGSRPGAWSQHFWLSSNPSRALSLSLPKTPTTCGSRVRACSSSRRADMAARRCTAATR
jgi:hypothetical protein